ncbi:hypothetical protein D9M73_175140 [compost metagenome]
MPPTFFSAAYMGLMAAPGTPNAVSTPSRRITSTAASIALILAIFCSSVLILIVYKSEAIIAMGFAEGQERLYTLGKAVFFCKLLINQLFDLYVSWLIKLSFEKMYTKLM